MRWKITFKKDTTKISPSKIFHKKKYFFIPLPSKLKKNRNNMKTLNKLFVAVALAFLATSAVATAQSGVKFMIE